MKKPRGPKQSLISGAIWTVGSRWVVRGIGFVNTVAMARLLVPADYGLVAMAMLLVGLVQALLDFGASTALLRKKEVTRDEVDSAWTLSLLQGLLMGLLLALAAPIAAAYFKEPRVEPIIWVFAVCVALAHGGNIGMVLAQKEFNFSLSFRISVIGKLIGAGVTISTGIFLRDYRALVLGVSAGYLSGLCLTYVLHPYRPRWNTTRIKEIWAVTKWLMLAGVGGFVLRKGDELIAARVGTTEDFGLYNVGADLGQLPTAELGPAILRAFLPVLSSIQDDIQRTNQAVLKTVSAVNTIILPVGAGFAALSLPAVELVLGPAWLAGVKFVAAFAIAGAVQTIGNPVSTLLVLRGFTRVQSVIVWLEFVVFLLAAWVLVPTYFLMGLVGARIAGSVVNLLATGVAARTYCGLSSVGLAVTVLRPLVGAGCMYALVMAVASHFESTAAQLVVGTASGALFFSLWCLATWALVGRPEGLESTVLDQARALRQRWAHRQN